jgi:hypothetical protein
VSKGEIMKFFLIISCLFYSLSSMATARASTPQEIAENCYPGSLMEFSDMCPRSNPYGNFIRQEQNFNRFPRQPFPQNRYGQQQYYPRQQYYPNPWYNSQPRQYPPNQPERAPVFTYYPDNYQPSPWLYDGSRNMNSTSRFQPQQAPYNRQQYYTGAIFN